jgi:hypothetical protein
MKFSIPKSGIYIPKSETAVPKFEMAIPKFGIEKSLKGNVFPP